MALYKITAKKTGTWGKVHFEKGMFVELAIKGAYSSMESIKLVKEAFLRKYNLDIEHFYSSGYLDYEKIN